MPIIIYKGGKITSRVSGGQYDGEKIPGDLDSWNVLSSDSNDIIENTYGTLSERSMTLFHTYGPAISAIEKQTVYAIGPGLVFRAQPNWQSIPWMKKTAAKEWGKELQRIVDYYMQRFNFYEKQSVLFQGSLSAGDSLLLFLREGGELTDLIEFGGDEIDWQFTRELIDNTGFKLGIKHDKYLRRLGIVKAEDGKVIDFVDPAGNQNLIQFYIKKQPRQLRGFPLVYSIINLAKNDDRHHDAITHRAVMEAILLGSYKTDTTDPILQTSNMAEANTQKAQRKGNIASNLINKIGNAFKLGAGNMYTMKKGEEVEFTDLKTPSDNFGEFKEWIINYIAAATGTPPEVILSKYSTSYTAHRGALNDFRKTYMKKRTTFIRTVMQPTIREIAKDAILKGLIKAPGFFENPVIQNAYIQGNYLGPIPGTINPLQEVQAAVKAVEEGIELRSSEAAQRGNEWDNFIEEWAEEEKEFNEKSPLKQADLIRNQETGEE